jgi:hypothetical protein
MSTSETTLEPEVITDKATQPLILKGEGYGLAISPLYQHKKNQLLASSALIAQVNNPEDDAIAAEQIVHLSSMRIATEKGRKEVKAPALAFGLEVDRTAATFVAELVAEETRIKKARGDYAAAVLKERQRVLAEMEAARQAEAERIRLAEAARMLAEREAEEARRKAEELAFNATTPEEDAEAAKMAEEAAAAEKERLRIAAEESARAATLPVSTPTFIPEAPKGVKMVADYEVTDLDELYRANPHLVTLSERRKEILEFIAAHTSGDNLPSVPGLRIFTRPQVR